MKLFIEFHAFGAVSPEAVKDNVARAILQWASNEGLSAEGDDGHIVGFNVQIVKEH